MNPNLPTHGKNGPMATVITLQALLGMSDVEAVTR
jgi:hypothetical protein